MHTCVFFTLICLACFPSSATARTDWFSDGHFSAEIDLSQAEGGGGGGGGYVEKCQNISISSRCKFDRFFRVTTCQQPRRLQHVSSRRRRLSSEHVVPAVKRHFSRRIWSQTPRGSLCSLAPLGSLTPLGSSGSYVYAHMRFLSPHLTGLLSIVCDGQDRPVQRWPLFSRNRPFSSVKISRFQIDANLTDSFALRRASNRRDSYTCPVVVVGRVASTWCQRPNDTSFGASGRKPRAARWAHWLRWARWLRIIAGLVRVCTHAFLFFYHSGTGDI